MQATQAAQQAEAGGSPVDVVAKATLATVRCSQVRAALSLASSPVTVVFHTLQPVHLPCCIIIAC